MSGVGGAVDPVSERLGPVAVEESEYSVAVAPDIEAPNAIFPAYVTFLSPLLRVPAVPQASHHAMCSSTLSVHWFLICELFIP